MWEYTSMSMKYILILYNMKYKIMLMLYYIIHNYMLSFKLLYCY